MASATAEITIGPMEIRSQVNKFLKGVAAPDSTSKFEKLSGSALFLLKTVPVARHAVLEHYANVFDEAIKASLNFSGRMPNEEQNMSPQQKKQLSALQDVTGVLLSFVKSSPEAWAPVVSSWALTLLGQLSSKYASMRGIQHATCLNEVLQMWLACQSQRLLMEISTECFAAIKVSYMFCRVGAAPDMCVDSLLEASVRYSPHFDWVVAHIGSCFPRTIITRVLNCGLKDFCNDGSDKDMGPGSSNANSRLKVPKMASVVGILGHLASKHSQDIRKALMALFEVSLNSESSSSKVTTLPFLLQLASMSEMLLHILASDLVSVLTPKTLNQLHYRFMKWKRASPGDYKSFLNLVVHLIMKSNTGACKIINFILNSAAPRETVDGEKLLDEVKDTCAEIMHILMFELQRAMLSRKENMVAATTDIPLLVGLAKESITLTKMLLNAQGRRVQWLQKLLIFATLQAGESCAASVLSFIICNATTQEQLGNLYSLKEGIELSSPTVIIPTLQQVFNRLDALTTSSAASSSPLSSSSSSSESSLQPPPAKIKKHALHDNISGSSVTKGDSSNAQGSCVASAQFLPLRNLERIVAVEKKKMNKKIISCSPLHRQLQTSECKVWPFLLHPDSQVQRCALSIISMVGFPDSLCPAQLTRIAGAISEVFFASLHRGAEAAQASCLKRKRLEAQGESTKSSENMASSTTPSKKSLRKEASSMTRLCMSCIEQLCSQQYTRSLLIHYLVEGATHKEHCHLFGGKWNANLFGSTSSASSSFETNVSTSSELPLPCSSEPSEESSSVLDTNSLLHENRQQSNSIALPRFHSKVYHGGVIRPVNKSATDHKPLSKEKIQSNILILVETLWSCCKEETGTTHVPSSSAAPSSSSSQNQPSWGAPAATGSTANNTPAVDTDLRQKGFRKPIMESSARTLGCILVDILTLDSLYNDVHWQDPDFRKVTTERDILVWKRLGDMSFLWSILQEFSSSCVFLFYVSPVLRSLVSVVMNHLEVSREPCMRNCPQYNEAAVKLVYCLAQGLWIPPPLSNVSELFPYVTPYEGYLLLLTIWKYIKDRPPSEFETEIKERTCDSSHMFVVNSIIHANIHHIGHLCTRIFNM